MQIVQGAESYMLEGGDHGVLLIHGFTGSPGELKLLGEYLHLGGFSVLGVRLPGHGTTPAELNKTEWPDWYAAVQDSYRSLSASCSRVSVVGLSMGGLLAMKLAAEVKVHSAVFFGNPHFYI